MTIRFELVPAARRDRWEEALRAIAHGYWHDWHPCNAVQAGTGLRVFLCVAHDAGGVLAACPLAERDWHDAVDVCTPAGFSGFAAARALPDGFGAAWHRFAAECGYVAGYFALHPVFACPGAHSAPASDNDVYVIDLHDGADEVLRRSDRSVRRALAEWVHAGHAYVTDRGELTRFLLEHYASAMARFGVSPGGIWSQETLAAMCADDALLMAGVADEQGVCAVHTFAQSGRGAEFHLNISIREGRRHTTALVAWGIRQLAARGAAWANMGGGAARGDAIARAKMKFRPRQVPFLRAREVYQDTAYRMLCERAGVDPDRPGFHPAYRRVAVTG